jgi:O-antigen/teichoic acid export membrane protein
MIKSAVDILRNLNPDFKKLLSGSGLVLFFKVFGSLAGYLIAFVITKNYGADTFGLFELALTFLTIFSVLGRMGLDGALVRFIPEHTENKNFNALRASYRFALSAALPIAIILGMVTFFAADFFEMWFDVEGLASYLKIVAFTIPFSTWMGLNSEAFRGMKEMVSYSIYQRGTVLLLAILAIYLGDRFYPSTPELTIFSYGIGVAALAFASGVFTPIKVRSLGEPSSTSSGFKAASMLNVAFPMLLSTSMFMVMNWTDTLMIGYYLDAHDVGIYRIAFKIAALITFAQFAINSIAAPMFSSFKAKKDMQGLRKMVRNIGYLNLLISGPAFLFIILFPNFLLELFGSEFSEGVLPLIILAIGTVINALCGPVMYLLNMTGKERSARNIIIIASLINIALNYYLIPQYGLMGAAYATSISTVIWNALAVIKIKRVYGFISIPHPF